MPQMGLTPTQRIDNYLADQKSKRDAFWMRRFGKLPDPRPRQTAHASTNHLVTDTSSDTLPAFQQRLPSHRTGRTVGAVAGKRNCKASRPLDGNMYELQAIKAVKMREDALERLQLCADKVDAGMAAGYGFIGLSDPLTIMFFRQVNTLRQRTLDAVECIAAWERLIAQNRPFVYRGVQYLATIGPELAFLQESTFAAKRLRGKIAADDLFLKDLTPDSIPLEEASTKQLHDGGRLNAESLRMRMAQKVLTAARQRSQLQSHDGIDRLVIPEREYTDGTSLLSAALHGHSTDLPPVPELSADLAPSTPPTGDSEAGTGPLPGRLSMRMSIAEAARRPDDLCGALLPMTGALSGRQRRDLLMENLEGYDHGSGRGHLAAAAAQAGVPQERPASGASEDIGALLHELCEHAAVPGGAAGSEAGPSPRSPLRESSRMSHSESRQPDPQEGPRARGALAATTSDVSSAVEDALQGAIGSLCRDSAAGELDAGGGSQRVFNDIDSMLSSLVAGAADGAAFSREASLLGSGISASVDQAMAELIEGAIADRPSAASGLIAGRSSIDVDAALSALISYAASAPPTPLLPRTADALKDARSRVSLDVDSLLESILPRTAEVLRSRGDLMSADDEDLRLPRGIPDIVDSDGHTAEVFTVEQS